MQKSTLALTLALGAITLVGGYSLGRAGAAVPVAMAQSGACCGTPAPVTQVLMDAPKFAVKDVAVDGPVGSGAVCATGPVSTNGYRTLVLHVPSCTFPMTPEFLAGAAGFVSTPNATVSCTPGPNGRGAIAVLDATMGTSFRITTKSDGTAKGCARDDFRITVLGVR
jgi:hypothetical protein